MAINEPPPVYSSLSEMDNLYFRGEEAKKKSLFLSPFTARKEPKVLIVKWRNNNWNKNFPEIRCVSHRRIVDFVRPRSSLWIYCDGQFVINYFNVNEFHESHFLTLEQ